MARFKLIQAIVIGYNTGSPPKMLRAGSTLADSIANSQPGDYVWPGLTSASMHQGLVPLDAGATTMKSASKYASEITSAPTGRDSIDA